MHSSGFFMDSVIEQVRNYLEEPVARITDDKLARMFIPDAWAEVVSLLKLSSDSMPIVRASITIAEGTSRYLIPPWVEMVLRLVIRDANGFVVRDWVPSDIMDMYPGWRIEGNEIVFEPNPLASGTTAWELWCVPSGDVCLHKGTGSVVSSSIIQLDTSPTLGILDRRPNAYAGQVLRVCMAGRVWQERIVGSYDAATGRATVLTAFTQDSTNLPANAADVDYEIAPLGWRTLWNMIAWKVAMMVGATRNIELKQMRFFELMYQNANKAVLDRSQVNWRVVKHLQRRTQDNNVLWDLSTWSFDAQS